MPGSSHLVTQIGQSGRLVSSHLIDIDSSNVAGNVGATTVFTTPKAPGAGTTWLAVWSISETVVNGATGTGVYNVIFTDPDLAAAQTVSVISRSVTATGTGSGVLAFKASPNTAVQFSVTGITGAPTIAQRLQFLRVK